MQKKTTLSACALLPSEEGQLPCKEQSGHPYVCVHWLYGHNINPMITLSLFSLSVVEWRRCTVDAGELTEYVGGGCDTYVHTYVIKM